MERYREICGDWAALTAAAERPLARVVWANPLRGDVERTAQAIVARCPLARPIDWYPGAWRLPVDEKPGKWPEYGLGVVHGQEEAALWAVAALDVRPGMSVLDLCAAPGNKTAQIAVALNDRGVLVANERRANRQAPLRFNLDRLGVTCAMVTLGDGLGFPLSNPPLFDRVLVDAPCSCEGTSRKSDQTRGEGERDRFRESISQLQVGLLRRAVRLVKPGGLVVYSTCTYAPEENEAVVDRVRDPIDVEPIVLAEGLSASPGLTEWNGHSYRADLANAVRVWPHQNDTGGFFAARLRRV